MEWGPFNEVQAGRVVIVNAPPGWLSALCLNPLVKPFSGMYMTFHFNYANYNLYQLREKKDPQH